MPNIELEESQENENGLEEKDDKYDQKDEENVNQTRSIDEIVSKSRTTEKTHKTKKKPSVRRAWSQMESEAVISYFSSYVKQNSAAPGKNLCEECLKNNKLALKQRTWKDIKYFVYNYMKKVNKH